MRLTFPYPEKDTPTKEEIQKIIEKKQKEVNKMTFPFKDKFKKEDTY